MSNNTADITKARFINLLNKDFAAFKKSLITYAQAYKSGSFSDFNEASPGMAWLELNAYVADVLAFYIDNQYNELRDQTATQLKNVQANAKMKGYKPAGKRPAGGILPFAIEVPSIADSFGHVIPDDTYTPVLLRGSQVTSNNGVIYETTDDVPFSASLGRSVTGSRFDQTTGLPTHFGIMRSVDVTAGRTATETFTITGFSAFKRIELSESDIIEVIDVVDSQGNDWFEVDFLAQDWVYSDATNENDTSGNVPYVLKIKSVPRRFVVDRDIVTGKSTLVFGSGDGTSFDDEYVPNLADLALPLAGRRTFSSFAVDPQNLLRTRSLGLSPYDTTLTVRYRVGGGQETNASEGQIRQVTKALLSFGSSNVDLLKKAAVEGSIGCFNKDRMVGGGPEESLREIKLNSAAHFASQNRVVTREDVVARVMSMPSRFGRPEKVFVKTTPGSRFSYDVHILSIDSDATLSVATKELKSNVATFLKKYRMLTDVVNVLDARIIDMKLSFKILASGKFNRSEVMVNCLSKLSDYFDVKMMQIGQPIILSDVVAFVQDTPGVVSVNELEFSNVFGVNQGLVYSDVRFDIESSKQDGMIICPPDSIFNFRYPRKDIGGSAR